VCVLVAAAGDDPAAKPLWGVTVHQRTAAIETDDLPVAAETFGSHSMGFEALPLPLGRAMRSL
jgi:hypothetical protein